MACHYLFLDNNKEFITKLQGRDIDLIVKMVKCVISAIKRKKKNIDIFEVTFKDTTHLVWSISEDQYMTCLSNCLEDLITEEEFELCSVITKLKQGSKQLFPTITSLNQVATYITKI